MAKLDGTTTTFPALEQCSICSTHYVRPSVTFPQPVLNRQMLKLLEIHSTEGQTLLNKYIPTCEECANKIKRFEKLRVELDGIKSETISSVLDTLMHIRSEESTPLDAVKNSIIQRWSYPHGTFISVAFQDGGFAPGKTANLFNKTPQVVFHRSPNKEISGNEITDKNIIWDVGDEYFEGSVEAVVEVETTDTFDVGSPMGDMGGDGGKDNDAEHGTNGRSQNSDMKDVKVVPNRRRKVDITQNNVDCQNNPPPFFCDNCGRTYSFYKHAMLHMKICKEDPEKQIKICVLCFTDFSSGSWYQLKMHYDSDHPGTILEKCSRCRKELLPGILDDHLCGGAIIKPVEKLECELCHFTFNTADTLQKHVVRRHKDLFDKGEIMSCEICGKQFVLKSMLDRHEKVHKRVTESKWQCDICNLYLSTRTGLKQHKTKHTGEMPFECDVCHKRFRMSSVLRCHKVVHTKEKNFECSICGEKFSLYSIMFRHWKRHKVPPGEGTYKCPMVSCFRLRFRRVYALKNHMKKRHLGTSEYDTIMEAYKNVDDRTKSRKIREGGNRGKRLKIKEEEKNPKAKRSDDIVAVGTSHNSDREGGRLSPLENDVGSDVGEDSDEVAEESLSLLDTSSSSIKRSARLAAKAKSRRKGKLKIKIKEEKNTPNRTPTKKRKPGPKSRRTKVKLEICDEVGSNEDEENGMSLEDHGDLITIKEEPADTSLENEDEGAEEDSSYNN